MTENDKRLVEDYIPIEAISAEASREKGVRKGHISTLHLWWARRPLVACRAAVYGVLVPASQFVPDGARDEKRKSLGRANAAKFVKSLCQYPGTPQVIREAQGHLLKAHAQRLSQELVEAAALGRRPAWAEEFKFKGERVVAEDITTGRAPRPRVLDMFAGGGAIPLEALRLGCEAYALDLNPVAHIIELCTLVYPQKHGQPDSSAPGMTGPKNTKGESTWGGLAAEVHYWGSWVLRKVKADIGDLYPLIPDPEFKGRRKETQTDWVKSSGNEDIPAGYLVPSAYLWARTVRCKNPTCAAEVPLFGQLWLRRKMPNPVFMKLRVDSKEKAVHFEVKKGVDASDTEAVSGFETTGSETSCPFCRATQDGDYIRNYGAEKGYGQKLMAVVCDSGKRTGKTYLSGADFDEVLAATEQEASKRLDAVLKKVDSSPLDATVLPSGNAGYATGKSYLHGIKTFRQCFSARQEATLLTFARAVAAAGDELDSLGQGKERSWAIQAYLSLLLSQSTNRYCALTRWNNVAESVADFSSMKRFALSWDWPEVNPWCGGSGNFLDYLERMTAVLENIAPTLAASVARGSATEGMTTWPMFDAVVTDPPYYDNESYAELSDMFYVWHRISAQKIFSEHLAALNTPKKKEVIAAAYRQGGTVEAARTAYLEAFTQSLKTANRYLKADGSLVLVYAHKTTSGWTSMISAVREAGFQIHEAWPLDTEKKGRAAHQDDAALASSIFLVARKREEARAANYEEQVRPDLEEIVRERVETLWDLGISGADLVIASIGAGLRAFTRFARVEYANGEEVPAERFLTEVETVVLETILARLSKELGGKGPHTSLAGLDPATRFYILWRYTYGAAEQLEAGEAIIFANGTHVELEGPHGLCTGVHSLVEKKKGKYRLRDFVDRGDHRDLGTSNNGDPAPLIDALQRTLWLMENHPLELPEFLRDAQPNREQMRLVAQALAGPALKGGELADVSPSAELAALTKLTANWRSTVEDADATTVEREARRSGQGALFGKGDR